MLIRSGKNPILSPGEKWWEDLAVFNPAVVKLGNKIHLFYRAVGDYENYISRLGHAIFDENLNLVWKSEKPVLSLGKDSVEDPSITKIGKSLYMTYVKVKYPSAPPWLREKAGLKPAKPRWKFYSYMVKLDVKGRRVKFRGHRRLTRKVNDKNVELFPEKIKGKYFLLHRPFKSLFKKPVIKIANFDLKGKGTLYNSRTLIRASVEKWSKNIIGAGAPPVKTEKGWLVIYHGAEIKNKRRVYSAGAMLLGLDKPERVIARIKKPVLKPEKDYEKKGDIDNVVFPTGTVRLGDELLVFYGAADKRCCAAKVGLKKMLRILD
jgi:predicted GH43/DUF377 family glycosyl hydrolase